MHSRSKAGARETAHAASRTVPAHALTRKEREQQAAEQREEALAELRERAARHTTSRGTRSSATLRQTARLEVPREVLRPGSRTADADAAPDSRVQDRVHAWYRARHPQTTDADERGSAAQPTEPRTVASASATPAKLDLSTTPRKATADDFARAAAAQRETIAAAREQQAHQTTADDDNADAESRIPSTAPTEREPAPFVHGSFGESPAPADDAPANHAQRQTAAPIVRQAASAVAPGVTLAPPQHVDLKHRGDGLSTALAADAAAQAGSTDSAAQRQIPVATAADSSPRAIRALAQQTASSPTPVLKLPAPPSGALRKELPAVAAVESGARRKELDPAVVSGMAEQTFDDGGSSPATARTAVALAAPSAVAGLVPNRTHALSDDADSAPTALVHVNLFDPQGHLILVPPMKGSHEILVHQNQMAVTDGLDRIRDDGDLLDLRQRKLLVALPDEDSTYPDDRLPANRRYARPWTVRFLRDLAKAHYARFGTPLIVTSAARTVEFQRRLVRVNGNAAPPTGDVASPHLYGQAIDIGKGHMSLTELTWMRAYLTPVENDGKIDVEEEFQQSCFHISVYRRYLGLPSQRRSAPVPDASATLLTAKNQPAPQESKPSEKKHRRISTALLATGLR